MTLPSRRVGSRACTVDRGERVVRGVIALVLAAFAVSSLDTLWCAIPAAACAGFLMVGAITGWCPTDLLVRTSGGVEPNDLGYPEAPQQLMP